MDPATIALLAQFGIKFLTTPRGPSAEQLAEAQARADAETRQKLILGGGLAAGALVLYLIASRR